MKWIKRNWKWFFPAIIFILFFVAILFMSLLKTSDVYKIALKKAQSNRILVEKIGKPIKAGFMVTGTIKWAGPKGSANISFALKGPKDSGVLYGAAEKSGGIWAFYKLIVTFKNGYRVNLLLVNE
jgi:hypothetical protein